MESVVHDDWYPGDGVRRRLALSSFTETLDTGVPENKSDTLSKSYDGSWSTTVKRWTISNYKVTDISIWRMERLAAWLSEWAAELSRQNWRGASSSCKLLAFLWTEGWKRLRHQGDSSLPQENEGWKRRGGVQILQFCASTSNWYYALIRSSYIVELLWFSPWNEIQDWVKR